MFDDFPIVYMDKVKKLHQDPECLKSFGKLVEGKKFYRLNPSGCSYCQCFIKEPVLVSKMDLRFFENHAWGMLESVALVDHFASKELHHPLSGQDRENLWRGISSAERLINFSSKNWSTGKNFITSVYGTWIKNNQSLFEEALDLMLQWEKTDEHKMFLRDQLKSKYRGELVVACIPSNLFEGEFKPLARVLKTYETKGFILLEAPESFFKDYLNLQKDNLIPQKLFNIDVAETTVSLYIDGGVYKNLLQAQKVGEETS